MTIKERVEKLRHLIKCLKCDVSGKPCGVNCPTRYSAGNMGEIIENLEEIAKVLDQEPCEDAISRKAVINIINEYRAFLTFDRFKELICTLPPVTPQESKPMVEIDLYSVIKQKYIEREVLDKIRAEIEDLTYHCCKIHPVTVIDDVLKIIDKYRAGSEVEHEHMRS